MTVVKANIQLPPQRLSEFYELVVLLPIVNSDNTASESTWARQPQ